ncbi:MAG: helix-turn-helix transcriptional regulator [Labilibaculum sp.]|nr:helix-turn-helix transcriptional regulator [Labilibaculum sp.]
MKKTKRVSIVTNSGIKHFATLLQINRKKKSMSIAELSVRLGVSYPTVQNMLNGVATVAIGTYFEAAYILGVSLFESDQNRFTILTSKSKGLEILLPKRVKTKKVELDDDF